MLFRIELDRIAQRTLLVSAEFDIEELALTGDDQEAVLFQPVWTPGSYLVREYSRHIGRFEARDAADHRPLDWRKSAKNRYAVNLDGARRLRLSYEIYAHELTVRTAYAVADWAYWNGACVLLWPLGGESLPARIEVAVPEGKRLICGKGDGEPSAEQPGLWAFDCADLDDAVDQPCLVGDFEEFRFECRGRLHRFCAIGLEGIRPPASFADDLRDVVDTVAALFPGELPFDEYSFLALFVEQGRGGLEHRSSSTLLAPRTVFSGPAEYRDFLALIAHEYLHVWNVKRMRPAEFWDFDYEREVTTELLWVAEGFTAYYDDLSVRRAGRMTSRQYLEILGRHLRGMRGMPGRLAQSLAEASYDAWIRFYRPDENTRNSTQNYYANGAVAAFLLDAKIRRSSDGERSLDDGLRRLFERTWGEGRGYRHQDVVEALSHCAGRDLGDEIDSLVHAPLDPDLGPALDLYGLRLQLGEAKAWVGFQLRGGTCEVAGVLRDGPAWRAGLCPGDEVVGIAGLRASAQGWGGLWSAMARPGHEMELLVAREGRLMSLRIEPDARSDASLRVVSVVDPDPEQLAYREAWLGAREI